MIHFTIIQCIMFSIASWLGINLLIIIYALLKEYKDEKIISGKKAWFK